MQTPIAQFTNSETGMTSFVFANSKAGFNVTLRDDDSGEFVPASICGISTIEAATAKAQEVVK